ncbi:unnamed protein product [marine sediment metagenome]|uniref:Uncharacterized protein n=1 Tax=marine sediment metagenome TaxID=412755 RepID=X0UBD3_9ZZZZ
MGTYDMPHGSPRSPDISDPPCDICGRDPGGDCTCPECPVCGVAGRQACISEHGLELPSTTEAAGEEAVYE